MGTGPLNRQLDYPCIGIDLVGHHQWERAYLPSHPRFSTALITDLESITSQNSIEIMSQRWGGIRTSLSYNTVAGMDISTNKICRY